jgi:cytochrome c553
MGGRDGEYPRIAGLPKAYIERQLSSFKSRKRLNKPMIPIFENWLFDQAAISELVDHVSAMAVDRTSIPDYAPADEILAQFDSLEQFNEVGEELFQDCVQCHGEDARGKADKESPPLVQQYPNYLRKQIGDFAAGSRSHEHAESMFGELAADEVEALIGYISGL